MKKIINIFVALLIIFAVLAVAKNMIAKGAVENGVQLLTGLQLKMKDLDVSLIRTDVGIKGLKLFNPDRFPEKLMVDMPEIYVDYDLQKLIKGKIHLPEVRIHLDQFVVVRSDKGELNLNALTSLQGQGAQGQKAGEAKPAEKAAMPEIQIDLFSLRIGKVIYKDYSGGGEPSVKEFTVGINEQYRNITDPNHLVRLIVLKTMLNTPLATLSGFDLSGLSAGMSDVLASSTQIAGKAAEEFKKQTTQLIAQTDNAQTLVKDASANLKETAGTLGDKAEDLTGGLKGTASNLKEKFKF